MVEKFQNTCRIPTARAGFHDYNGGVYFVTICTKGREHYFGKIVDGQMQLSEIGQKCVTEIDKTAQMRADMQLAISTYVVMPNHVHLIVIIGENSYNTSRRDALNASQKMPDNSQDARNAFRAKVDNDDKAFETRATRLYDVEMYLAHNVKIWHRLLRV